jgi:hypothetical protein
MDETRRSADDVMEANEAGTGAQRSTTLHEITLRKRALEIERERRRNFTVPLSVQNKKHVFGL